MTSGVVPTQSPSCPGGDTTKRRRSRGWWTGRAGRPSGVGRPATPPGTFPRTRPAPMNSVVNLEGTFGRFDETWTPHVVAELNGQLVKLAKLDGEFLWHDHPREDELLAAPA